MSSFDIETSPKQLPSYTGLRHKGYAYNREHASKDGTKQYWYCKAGHTAVKCPARIHTLAASGEVLQELNEHNHPPVAPLKTELVLRSPVTRRVLRHKGFVYYRDMLSRNGTKRHWYCRHKRSEKCSARVHTSVDSGEVVYESGEHSHPPIDAVDKKDPDGGMKDSPKLGLSMKRRHTLNASQRSGPKLSKKRRASCAVNINNK